MELAFKAATEALDNQEVPVGCVFVLDGKVIATGRNRVNETKNACMHAEFVCLNQVVANQGREVLPRLEVYVTVEPCIMCAAMLGQIGVRKIVYGAPNDRFGGLGSVLDILRGNSRVAITSGVQKERAVALLKKFYTGQNPNTECLKRKNK
ncbi:tRNA-specific adenosine deaminase 2 [Galendromus occidentalis]|uniref:tRNA-specific adenosine deaminase 2 n=1 Tax=Galendromus occidentalis TaxID=34638 RepID=A0AAJ7L4W4_9ACAR|nr:tRNA-specific adenosine deaminase 2 [Galendromus occidentalis]